MTSRDYVSVVYNENERPLTDYPDRLTRYLSRRYRMPPGESILDIGCGRGEFLRGFIRCGLKGFGVDQSPSAQKMCPGAEVIQSDLENYSLPYDDARFKYIFSKSVLEHFYYPEKLVREIYRILKPGGTVLTMVPDWHTTCRRTFYDDYTHRTPFTETSLRDIFLIHGFNDVKVEKFRQLPFLWSRPWLTPFTDVLAAITPEGLNRHSRLIRFSKELMLLASAVK